VGTHLHGRDALGSDFVEHAMTAVSSTAVSTARIRMVRSRRMKPGADEDDVTHRPHGVGAGVTPQHIAHQPVSKPERDKDRHGHQVGQLLR
jgi:hypothetical protein